MIAKQMYSEKSSAAVCRDVSALSEWSHGAAAVEIEAPTFCKASRTRPLTGIASDETHVDGKEERGEHRLRLTFCQLQVLYLIAFSASSSTSRPISSPESSSEPAGWSIPGGGPILLILRPSGNIVEPRRCDSASFSLIGTKVVPLSPPSWFPEPKGMSPFSPEMVLSCTVDMTMG